MDRNLNGFIDSTCCENNICVDFDENLNNEDYIVIKLDEFYEKQGLEEIPPTPDCLIIQKCEKGHYHIYAVELKNVDSSKNQDLSRRNIRSKFHTCLTDFMSNRFRDYFYDENYKLILQLFLVAGKVDNNFSKNFKFDFLLGLHWVKFADKYYQIKGENPNPLVQSC